MTQNHHGASLKKDLEKRIKKKQTFSKEKLKRNTKKEIQIRQKRRSHIQDSQKESRVEKGTHITKIRNKSQ